jgi:hypothetical protein
MHAVAHFYGGYYQGPSNPCIVGANGRVWAANGPFLIRSDDGGLTFGRVSYWEVYWYGCPSTTILGHRLYDSNDQPLQSPPCLITELNISSIDGPAGDDAVILVKLDDLIPVSGQTQLFTYVFKSYTEGSYKNNYYKPIFQQFLSPDVSGQHLSSYNVAVLGADYNDKLVFSAQTRVVNGISVPSLKYSTDGGTTWIDVDLSKIKIGNPNEGGNYGGTMLDDNFAKMTWIAPPCNNQGYYDFIELYRRQCQSYEMDLNIRKIGEMDYTLDTKLAERHSKNQEVDALMSSAIDVPYNIDYMAEKIRSKSYQIGGYAEALVSQGYEVDGVVSVDGSVDDTLDALISGKVKKKYQLGLFIKSKMQFGYNIDAVLVKDRLNERLTGIVRDIPQFLDTDVPDLPYGPLDSRKEIR